MYLNIGLFSEEWLTHFKPLLGNFPFKRITPIEISVLEKNSTYWNANTAQTPDVGLFFLASARPDRLAEAPGGSAYLSQDEKKLRRGKIVFAENCAQCHSSKQPPPEIPRHSREYYQWMRKEVVKDDFLEGNFLSTDERIPVTLLDTNACSPLATNGVKDNIWDNFSSTTYKELPSAGNITVHHPSTGEPWEYVMPGGGRGYTRPASLVSLWSTAPFLLNNSVGNFYGDGSVETRMASFDDSIQKMLWPERRRKDEVLGDKVPGYIQRTTSESYLRVPAAYLSASLQASFPDGIEIGPIPKGTPVGLLANLPLTSEGTGLKDKVAHFRKLTAFIKKAKKDLRALRRLPEDERSAKAKSVFADLVDPLVELSKCPDYVVNRGHYFGTSYQPKKAGLTDADKWTLIEFLKTL